MKPNLPLPPSDIFGFRVGMYEECDIDQELIDHYTYARESYWAQGYWELFRPPNADESVPIMGTKGKTLPGDHHKYKLEI